MITENEQGQLNAWAKEPKMYIDPNHDYSQTHAERAELLNGRVAMISVILAMVSYATTKTLAFGLF